eukprot:TRINITY_DN2888_c0_g3_i1.p1 TRINITY_DN2888_c0_g3~~TRINITY_DN2888_c0_g3_i1.p1  ORF type:complete len:352 (+),score=99.16 TRINITY_DN2888_c0_g3_i1:164-1219(+)
MSGDKARKSRKPVRNLGLPSAEETAHKYEHGALLGQGTFASVRAARRVSDGLPVAIKIIGKRAISKHIKNLRLEIAINEHVSHPAIVELLDKYEDDENVYLVMEQMAGGELLTRLVKEFPKGYDECKARHIVRCVVEAVNYLHKQGIVHRDLKPENLLFASEDSLDLKVTDFGLAQVYQQDVLFQTSCGSPNYVAPEVLKQSAQGGGGGYTFAVDMWSVGCVAYVVMCGFCPFAAEKEAVLFRRILDGDFDFPSPTWDHLSKEAISFVQGCLTVDPCKRLTPQEALEHPWFTMEDKELCGQQLGIAHALAETVRDRASTKEKLQCMPKCRKDDSEEEPEEGMNPAASVYEE